MNCIQIALIIVFALKANTPGCYQRAMEALRTLTTDIGSCTGHTKIVEQLLVSSGTRAPFQKALEQHKLMVRLQLFFGNIEKALREGGAFIELIQEMFPGEPATLADRIFEATDSNPEAMQLFTMYGRTPDEIALGTNW
jgi:hypothetical protein